MSPEQARGEWDHVGPASDVYSLGSTLFVLLTGKIPSPGKSIVEVVNKVTLATCLTPHATATRSSRRRWSAHLPQGNVVSAPRTATPAARDLAGDIERGLADEPVLAWKEPLAVRARRWLKRNRTLVTTSVAVLLVGLFATIAAGRAGTAAAATKSGRPTTSYPSKPSCSKTPSKT